MRNAFVISKGRRRNSTFMARTGFQVERARTHQRPTQEISVEQMEMNIESLKMMLDHRNRDNLQLGQRLRQARRQLDTALHRLGQLSGSFPQVHFQEHFGLKLQQKVSKLSQNLLQLKKSPKDQQNKKETSEKRVRSNSQYDRIDHRRATSKSVKPVQPPKKSCREEQPKQNSQLVQKLRKYEALMRANGIGGVDRLAELAAQIDEQPDQSTIGFLMEERERLTQKLQLTRQKRQQIYLKDEPRKQQICELRKKIAETQQAIRKLKESERESIQTLTKLSSLMRMSLSVADLTRNERERVKRSLLAMKLN